MKNLLKSLMLNPKAMLSGLLSPPQDPRRVYAVAYQRQKELMGKVRQAKANVAASKSRLQAKTEEVRQNLSWPESTPGQTHPEGREGLARLAQRRRQAALEELHGMEQQVQKLEQDEGALTLIEQRLAAEIEAFSTRQEVAAARYSTAEAQLRINEALAGLSEELASLGLVLERAEQRTEEMQAEASTFALTVDPNSPESEVLNSPRKATEGESDAASPADLKRLKRKLQTGFSRMDSGAGLKALRGLAHQYDHLRPLLVGRKSTDPLAVAYIPSLAEETYRQGLSVLAGALVLTEAMESSGKEGLQAEIIELEREIVSLSEDGTQATRVRLRQEALASHRERMEVISRQQLRVDQLLLQSGRCEASLERTRMELAALKAESSEGDVSAVTETLQRTIDQAREVQEELKKLGF